MYRPFKKLRLRMIEMDYNQKDLAKAAGIVPSTFSLRIRGKQPFDSAQIAAIARVLNIPTSEMEDFTMLGYTAYQLSIVGPFALVCFFGAAVMWFSGIR